jgi:hypothetical protein
VNNFAIHAIKMNAYLARIAHILFLAKLVLRNAKLLILLIKALVFNALQIANFVPRILVINVTQDFMF